MNVKEYNESENKHNKIATHLYKEWDNILWDKDTDDEYMEQILDYAEKQEPDDSADSAGSLLKMHFNDKIGSNALWEW